MDDLTKALEATNIEAWLDAFLLSEIHRNKGLYDGLKKQKRYWIGPVEIDLERIKRTCGPEEEMKYKEEQQVWDTVIERMKNDLREGWKPAPLVATFKGGIMSVADGNHRMGALISSGYKKYWTIIWADNEAEYNQLKQFLGNK
jgi:hypothetical protein